MDNEASPGIDNLSSNFEKALTFFNELENTNLATNDSKYQEKVKLAISLLEQSTEMVNKLGLFSVNETIDDVTTQSVKYLLLPALLGYFTTKLVGKERLECIKIADIYFKDFLKRVKSYDVCPVGIDLDEYDDDDSGDAGGGGEDADCDDDTKAFRKIEQSRVDIQAMATERQQKIENYRRQKEIQEKLESLQSMINNCDEGDVNDEQRRELYILLIKKWVGTAIDEINSIRREKPILEQMAKLGGKRPQPKDTPKSAPLKPFIITRTELQKKVYGLGYPAVPTMSIESFIESKIQEGSLTEAKPGQENSLMEWAKNPDLKKQQDEDDAEVKEKAEEREDVEALNKARDWDEFKDENKRGWGNRFNRS